MSEPPESPELDAFFQMQVPQPKAAQAKPKKAAVPGPGSYNPPLTAFGETRHPSSEQQTTSSFTVSRARKDVTHTKEVTPRFDKTGPGCYDQPTTEATKRRAYGCFFGGERRRLTEVTKMAKSVPPPGHTQPDRSSNPAVSPAAAGFTASQRKEWRLPDERRHRTLGPGAYDPDEKPTSKNTTSPRFTVQVRRSEANGPSPGPGSYSPTHGGTVKASPRNAKFGMAARTVVLTKGKPSKIPGPGKYDIDVNSAGTHNLGGEKAGCPRWSMAARKEVDYWVKPFH